jgi:hypothetical protein
MAKNMFRFSVDVSEDLARWMADTALACGVEKSELFRAGLSVLKVHQAHPGSHLCLSKDGETVDKKLTNLPTQRII